MTFRNSSRILEHVNYRFEGRGGGDATYVAKGQIGEFRFLKELRKSDCELS